MEPGPYIKPDDPSDIADRASQGDDGGCKPLAPRSTAGSIPALSTEERKRALARFHELL